MGKKKKQKRPQQSFQDAVANAASNMSFPKIQQYIDQKILRLAEIMRNNQRQSTETMFIRIVALEKLLMEKFNVDKNEIIDYVAKIEDEHDGYTPVINNSAVVQESNRVRLEISTKAKDQDDFQGTSKMVVNNVGSGESLGKQLESNIIGMKMNETKELDFGEDMVAKITIERISFLNEKEEQKEETSNEG